MATDLAALTIDPDERALILSRGRCECGHLVTVHGETRCPLCRKNCRKKKHPGGRRVILYGRTRLR